MPQNISAEMFWAACSVPRGHVTEWPCFLRRRHEKHVGESLFSTRQIEVLRGAASRWLGQEGLEHCLGMQTLAWQEDFVGPGMPSDLDRLQPHHRNAVVCWPLAGRRSVLEVPPSCSSHRWLTAGSSHLHEETWTI